MKFVSYDIQPVEHGPYGTCALDSIPAPGGQAEDTTWCWGLYGRDESGFAHHIGDYAEFQGAREVYVAITGNNGVQAEPGVLMRLPASALSRLEVIADAIIEAAAGGKHPFEEALVEQMRISGCALTREHVGIAADTVMKVGLA